MSTTDEAQAKRLADFSREIHAEIRRQLPSLMGLAQTLWDHPERTGQEFESSRTIQSFLRERGFFISPGNSGLPNAFIATFGNGPFVVDISVEMDALPVAFEGRPVNHACGHNVMAAMSIATGLALQKIAEKAGITIRLQGDPGEEGLGQKIIKLEAGDYDGAHIYMGPHSADKDRTALPSMANAPLEVRMIGHTGHDANDRKSGRPVAKGLFHFLDTLGEIETYSPPGTNINTQNSPYFPAAGQANVVGDAGIAKIMVRHTDTAILNNEILPRVIEAARGQGIAHGLGVVARAISPIYAATDSDPDLSRLFVETAAAEGREVRETTSADAPASTDFWNVPIEKIHPMVDIRDGSDPDKPPVSLHSPAMIEMANPTRNPKGISDAIAYAGAAFAMVVAKIAANPELLKRFTAHALNVEEIRNGPAGRPACLSAHPGWDKAQVLYDPGVAVDQNLFVKAADPAAPEFAFPSM